VKQKFGKMKIRRDRSRQSRKNILNDHLKARMEDKEEQKKKKNCNSIKI